MSVFASARAQPHHRPSTGEMSRWSRRRAHGRLGRRARDILSTPASVGRGWLLTAQRGPPLVTVLITIQKWLYSRNTRATPDPLASRGQPLGTDDLDLTYTSDLFSLSLFLERREREREKRSEV